MCKVALRMALVVMVMTAGLLPIGISRAQQMDAVVIGAPDTAQAAVTAWAEAFAAARPEFVYELKLYGDDAALMAALSTLDIVFYAGFDQDLPIVFECGEISAPYVVLPDLGARYLAGTDCPGTESPKVPLLADFLGFAVSPDGQQIAIDLGLLPATVEVVDQGGVTVSVPQPVRRIAAAYGVATYYVYTVGEGDRLVAAAYVGLRGPADQDAMRRIDPDFDAKFTAVSVMGQREVNIEELAALQPDLVLASARTAWLDTVNELGIPILRFQGESPELLKEAMTLTGAVLGPHAAYRAAQFNVYYDARLAEIEAELAGVESRPSVYFSGTEPLRVASGEMYQTAMIALAGGTSVSADLTGGWNDVNLEQVAVWNPDYIFVPTYGGASVEAFTDAPEWAIIPAVSEGRVLQLPKFISPWDTPLPDSILGIMWMAEVLHPQQVDLDCPAQTRTFYSMFYDYAMSDEEVQALCK